MEYEDPIVHLVDVGIYQMPEETVAYFDSLATERRLRRENSEMVIEGVEESKSNITMEGVDDLIEALRSEPKELAQKPKRQKRSSRKKSLQK